MLGSITPLGERGRNSRWWVTMTAFVLGSTAGGVMLGGGLGWLGSLVEGALDGSTPTAATSAAANGTASLLALGVVMLIGAAFDLGAMPVALPTVHRQVDERWLQRYRGWVYGLGFGFQLGLGVVTIVVTAAVYAIFAAAFLSGSAFWGAAIGGTFGLARAATTFSVARVTRPDQLMRVDTRLRRMDRPSRRIAGAVEVGLASAALLAGWLAW
jgi:hypothetical protein